MMNRFLSIKARVKRHAKLTKKIHCKQGRSEKYFNNRHSFCESSFLTISLIK
jgi:hypothetical protein